jgi:hypothetical protein
VRLRLRKERKGEGWGGEEEGEERKGKEKKSVGGNLTLLRHVIRPEQVKDFPSSWVI